MQVLLGVGLVVAGLAGCRGDGPTSLAPDGPPDLDAALEPDGAIIDAAPAPDSLAVDAPIDAAIDWCAALGHPVEALATPSTLISVIDRVEFLPFWYANVALRSLTTSVRLESLTFDIGNDSDLLGVEMTAGCGGTEVVVATPHSHWYPGEHFVPTRWFEGTGHDLPAGTYVFTIHADLTLIAPPKPLTVHGTIALGEACTDPLVAAGVLRCGPTHACVGGVCVVAACSDGVDGDGDGLVDAADPGCAAIDDADEVDGCPGAACPACADGADDDGDALVDWPADIGCARLGDPDEVDCHDPSPIIEVGGGGTFPLGAAPTVTRTCQRFTWTDSERMFHVTLGGTVNSLRFGTYGAYAIYRDRCDTEPVECVFVTPEGPEGAGGLPAGDYYIAAFAHGPVSILH